MDDGIDVRVVAEWGQGSLDVGTSADPEPRRQNRCPSSPFDEQMQERFDFAWTYIFVVLIGLIVIFTIWHGTKFFDRTNFRNIALDSSQLMLLAVGMTFVIITAGIDLSCQRGAGVFRGGRRQGDVAALRQPGAGEALRLPESGHRHSGRAGRGGAVRHCSGARSTAY